MITLCPFEFGVGTGKLVESIADSVKHIRNCNGKRTE